MLHLTDHFQAAWPGFRSWELARNLSHEHLNSYIKTGSRCAKHLMGLQGRLVCYQNSLKVFYTSKQEQWEKLEFQSPPKHQNWRDASVFFKGKVLTRGLRTKETLTRTKKPLPILSANDFAVMNTIILFFFLTTKVPTGIENSLCLFLLLKDTYAFVESSEIPRFSL